MKSIFAFAALLAATLFLTSATIFVDGPQDPPKKGEKHISMVKVDDKGNKISLDTVIAAGQVFLWNGDTIGDGKEMKWIAEGGNFNFDGDMDFDFDVTSDDGENVFVLKSGKMSAPKIFEFKSDGDSAKQYHFKMLKKGDGKDIDIMQWHSDPANNVMFGPPSPKVMMFGNRKKANVIDLSDPGIISYTKKEMKGGKEKIVIVREKPSTEDVDQHEELFFTQPDAAPMIWHGAGPSKTKEIKVIAGDDGKVEILENGGVWSVDEMEEGTKVIEKDGKKIVIKKMKEGDEVKVNVEVEENKEEK